MDRRPYGVCWNSYGRANRAVSTQNYNSLISIAYDQGQITHCWIRLYTVRRSSCKFWRCELLAVTRWSLLLLIVSVMFCITLWSTFNAKLTIHYLNMHMDDSASVADMLSADWGISSSIINLRRYFLVILCANCIVCNESEDV